jgi:membrane protease YdiL (CAAX protease family)
MSSGRNATIFWGLGAGLIAATFTLLPVYTSIPVFYKLLRVFTFSRAIGQLYQSQGAVLSVLGLDMYWVVASLSTLFLLWGWMWFIERHTFWTLLKSKRIIMRYARGVLIGIVMLSASLLIVLPSNAFTLKTNALSQTHLQDLTGVSLAYLGWMLQGLKEECVYRGWLLPLLGVHYKPWPSILLSSLAFALMHITNPHFTVIGGINLTLFGVFCALYALADDNIWGVAGLHAAWNWAEGHVFGLPISGISYHGGSIFAFQNSNYVWLNGGAFGPEGGIAVTIVLLASIAFVSFALRSLASSAKAIHMISTQPLLDNSTSSI